MTNNISKTFKASPLWKNVFAVCRTLHERGFTAWIAGGAVRDGLLKIAPKDFDVATSCPPESVEKFFEKTVSIGKQFGVVKVVTSKGDVEVATFRKDGLYVDGRRPEHVDYSSPEEDAARRDFTINAIFFDPINEQVIDHVGGILDLKKKVIRTVGDPRQRFGEDRLRILRAVRFISQLGFKLEKETEFAVKEMAPQIRGVSGERFFDEMTKLLIGHHLPLAINALKKTGLEKVLSPSLDLNIKAFKFKNTDDLVFLWGLLVIQIKNPDDQKIFVESLKTSTNLKRSLERVPQLASQLLSFFNLPLHQRLRLSAEKETPVTFQILKQMGKLKKPDLLKLGRFLKSNSLLPKAFITSVELKALGVNSGPRFGALLSSTYDAQLDGVFKTKKAALAWLKEKL